MGTSAIYQKMNDIGLSFISMTKKDLKELKKLFSGDRKSNGKLMPSI